MINSALSKNIDSQLLINQLEGVLNQRKDHLLKELFLKKSFNQFNKRYNAFREKYKDVKWSIKPVRTFFGDTFFIIRGDFLLFRIDSS